MRRSLMAPGGSDTPFDGEGSLQSELDGVLWQMVVARSQKSDRGCWSLVGGVASCVGIVVGMLLIADANGIALAVCCGFGLLGSIVAPKMRLPAQENADLMAVQLGSRLTGKETLRIDKGDLDILHKRLLGARPMVTTGILKILAVAGDETSLWYARALTDLSAEGHLFPAMHDPTVNDTAEMAVRRIEERIALARMSGTLLRPAEAHDASELLRPASSEATPPEQLLRAHTSDGVDP